MKRKMKNLLFYLMAMTVICFFTACGENEDESSNSITVTLTSANLTEDGYFDGMLFYAITSNSPKEVTVKKASKSVITVIIPSIVTIDGTNYKCTSIFEEAFRDCQTLTTVSIPNSITSIGDNAFKDCKNLQQVHTNDLSAWCKISFLYNTPLRYAHHLYLNGNEITNLTIPNDVTSISESAFHFCSSLTKVIIPNCVTSIGMYAFYFCI